MSQHTELVERLRELLGKARQGRWWAFANSGIRCVGYGETIHDARSNLIFQSLDDEKEDQNIDLVAEAINALPTLLEALSVNPLREALEPFADALEEWGEDELTEDGRSLWDHPLGMCITVGDFRAARKALGEQQP